MPRPELDAAYDSTCPVCLDRIYEGERIGLVEQDGEWAHLRCAEDEMPWEDKD